MLDNIAIIHWLNDQGWGVFGLHRGVVGLGCWFSLGPLRFGVFNHYGGTGEERRATGRFSRVISDVHCDLLGFGGVSNVRILVQGEVSSLFCEDIKKEAIWRYQTGSITLFESFLICPVNLFVHLTCILSVEIVCKMSVKFYRWNCDTRTSDEFISFFFLRTYG